MHTLHLSIIHEHIESRPCPAIKLSAAVVLVRVVGMVEAGKSSFRHMVSVECKRFSVLNHFSLSALGSKFLYIHRRQLIAASSQLPKANMKNNVEKIGINGAAHWVITVHVH